MTETIGLNSVVSFHYVLCSAAGKELDRSGAAPLEYLHGHGGIVPGLEVELEGKSVGDKLEVVVKPGDGYGELQQNSTKTYPKTSFPSNVAIGMQFMVEGSDGRQLPVWIREIKKDRVVVDRNHPLAGKALHFSIEVVALRAALPEELAHGHVHKAGDHHHH